MKPRIFFPKNEKATNDQGFANNGYSYFILGNSSRATSSQNKSPLSPTCGLVISGTPCALWELPSTSNTDQINLVGLNHRSHGIPWFLWLVKAICPLDIGSEAVMWWQQSLLHLYIYINFFFHMDEGYVGHPLSALLNIHDRQKKNCMISDRRRKQGWELKLSWLKWGPWMNEWMNESI